MIVNLEYDVQKLADDLKNFTAAGAYAFCKESPFKKQVDDFLAADVAALEKVMNENGYKGAVLDFSNIVDRQKSSPEATVFDFQKLRAGFEKNFGEESEQLLGQWKICRIGREGTTEVDEKWAALGKGGKSGVCKNNVGKRLLVVHNTDEELPVLQAMMFYHEACHALQSMNGLFSESVKLEMFYNTKITETRNQGLQAPPPLLAAASSLISHRHYLREAHAETFAMAALAARAGNREESEHIRNFMLGRARDNLWNGAGFSFCIYKFYCPAAALAQSFDGNDVLRKSFVNADGTLKLKDLLRFTEKIVRQHSYTRKEFWAYKRFDHSKQNWDALEKENFPHLGKEIKTIRASRKVCGPSEQSFLLSMFRNLKKAKSDAEITTVLKSGKSDWEKQICQSLLKIFRQRKTGTVKKTKDDRSL